MNRNEWDERARSKLHIGSDQVQRHMDFMKEMVRVDSRSFNVNEFEGDRTTPTDMKEILQLAQRYLQSIGFPTIHINVPPPGPERSTPILMAEISVSKNGMDIPRLNCGGTQKARVPMAEARRTI